LSGGGAGFISQSCIYPLEITKTRLALAEPGMYKGIFGCMTKISKHEGVFALFNGWGASVIGIIPYASIDLAVFNFLKEQYIS
jgi:solute carrier family 25 (mitochondrial phosphate transporter), member 23/24/25/41